MEIEVKYQTDQAQARQLFCHPLLAPYLGPAHQIPMQAVYYDTAQGECAAAGFVLRLRREGETAICTAKGGRVVDGVARRTELETPASSLEEGVCALLRRPDWPAAWRAPLEEPLVETARMEFTRLAAEFRQGDLAVEVCYDQGWIEAGGKRAPIGECELELKQGAEKDFLALVDQLQQALGWKPWETSKYRRAQELMR